MTPAKPLLVGDVLAKIKAEKGLTYGEISKRATLAGYDLPADNIKAYTRAERAGTMPTADSLEALAAGLGVEPDVFYEWPIALAAREARPSVTERARSATRRLDGTRPTSRRKPRARGDEGPKR